MTAEVVAILQQALDESSDVEREALQAELKRTEEELHAAVGTVAFLTERRDQMTRWLSHLDKSDEYKKYWNSRFQPGQVVEHPDHGKGEVVEYLTESPANPKGEAWSIYLVHFMDDGSERQVLERDLSAVSDPS